MNDEYGVRGNDPDYSDFHYNKTIDRSRISEQESKNKTISKIETILNEQFSNEIKAKEQEIVVIDKRICQTRAMLDRLRAYVAASYYGSGEKLIPMSKDIDTRKRKCVEGTKTAKEGVIPVNKVYSEKVINGEIRECDIKVKTVEKEGVNTVSLEPVEENRFYTTKEVIVGNVSKYLVAENRKENDKATHKWMVYVRGPTHEPDISYYIKSVWFFLHPSYIPNDIIQIHKPPFQLTRRGWGEFPVRVQLHFKDGQNKRFDIIHNLKLDKTYTGLQTLGAETIVKLELHRHATDSLYLDTQKRSYYNNLKHQKVFPTPHIITEAPKQPSDENQSDFEQLPEMVSEKVNNEYPNVNSSMSFKKDACYKFKQIVDSEAPSAVSSCVTSAAVSRSSSPVDFSTEQNLVDDETHVILEELVLDAPLIDMHTSVHRESFSSSSYEKYFSWSFSKRRASEWQRAVFLKKLFIEYLDANNKSLVTPTTKTIMIWCRRNGHTPAERKLKVVHSNDENSRYCNSCGVFIESNSSENYMWCLKCMAKQGKRIKFESLTPFASVLYEIRQKEEALVSLQSLQTSMRLPLDNDLYVDIESLSNSEPLISKEKLFHTEVPSSDCLDWVYNTANDIDVHLPSVTCNQVKGPILQKMLVAAMKRFASDLLRKSNNEAVSRQKSALEPVFVTCRHLYCTILKNQKFDFLTEACLGKEFE